MQASRSFFVILIFASFIGVGSGCTKFNLFESKTESPSAPQNTSSKTLMKIAQSTPMADSLSQKKDQNKEVVALIRLFEQADAVHREVWRVLTEQQLPVTKTLFGKVQRGLVSSTGQALSNKSLFLCDRYAVRKDVMGAKAFPQKLAIYEACSSKVATKAFAEVEAKSEKEVEVIFTPAMAEEVVGLSSAVLNKLIHCQLKGTESGALQSMSCQDWAQSKNEEQMIRLQTYVFDMGTEILIRLNGKVYENLQEIRKIETVIPLKGDIVVTETELHAPTPEPRVPVASTPPPAPQKVQLKDGLPPGLDPEQEAEQREINQKAIEERSSGTLITPLPGTNGAPPLQRYKQTDEGLVPIDDSGEPLAVDPTTGLVLPQSQSDQNGEDSLVNEDETEHEPLDSGAGQNLPSPDLPEGASPNQDPMGEGSGAIEEAPMPPPRQQPVGGGVNGR